MSAGSDVGPGLKTVHQLKLCKKDKKVHKKWCNKKRMCSKLTTVVRVASADFQHKTKICRFHIET
jgi:hypothetical protein